MKHHIFKLSLILMIISLLIAGCAPATPQTVEVTRVVAGTPVVEQVVVTATPAPVEERPFRVALILPSTTKDASFSQSMYDALVKLQEEMGKDKLELAVSESMFKIPDAAAAIRDYAAQGYDLVIAHGSQYGSSLPDIARDFPDTAFAWGTTVNTFQGEGINNVFAYETRAQEGGYVIGAMAALMSKSGIIGVCGPIEAGDGKLYTRGFVAGAKAVKPDIEVPIVWTGSYSDVTLMANCAQTHIQNGADVLSGSSQSVTGAIAAAKEKGVYWFGQQYDQIPLAPEVVVASQVYDWSGILSDIITSVKAGVKGGKVYVLTFKNGGLSIKYNDKIEIPAEVKAVASETIEKIKNGEIEIPIE
jgi:basic membrane lipoprotein Med (substrate-binding protein (PBP1-ABC) superfamily)